MLCHLADMSFKDYVIINFRKLYIRTDFRNPEQTLGETYKRHMEERDTEKIKTDDKSHMHRMASKQKEYNKVVCCLLFSLLLYNCLLIYLLTHFSLCLFLATATTNSPL